MIITRNSLKGTDRSPQEYFSPLLILTGEDYSKISFDELHSRICTALRGNRTATVAEILRPDGTRGIVRDVNSNP